MGSTPFPLGVLVGTMDDSDNIGVEHAIDALSFMGYVRRPSVRISEPLECLHGISPQLETITQEVTAISVESKTDLSFVQGSIDDLGAQLKRIQQNPSLKSALEQISLRGVTIHDVIVLREGTMRFLTGKYSLIRTYELVEFQDALSAAQTAASDSSALPPSYMGPGTF